MEEEKKYKLKDFIQFNPTEKLAKGELRRKIAMEQLSPFTRYVDSINFEKYNGGAKFRNGDTIMARITPCLENGKTAYVSSLNENEVAFGSTEYIVLRNINHISNSNYIYYLATSPMIRELAIKSMVGSSGRQRVQQSVLENFEMELPALHKQQQIAAILSSLDDKIELNRRINDNLEQQAQALFKSWFVDFEPFKGGKFVESELGMIPEGWSIKPLKDFITISKKTVNPQRYPNTVFTHYSLPACDNGLQPEIQYGSEIMSNKIMLEDNTILFSKLNPRIKRIWFTSLIENNSVCSTEFIPYKAMDRKQYSFVYSLINSKLFYSYVLGFVNGATGSHQRFRAEDTLDLNFSFNDAVVDKFCNLMNPILAKTHSLRLEILNLSKIRDLLLPKLMSGELKINNLHR